MPSEEDEVLKKHSTPSLRRNELGRFAKKEHLASNGVRGDEAKKILDYLYGAEEESKDG